VIPSVLQVVLSLNPGGTERLVLELVERLAGESRQAVCCLDEAGAWGEALESDGTPVRSLRRQPGFHPWLAKRLAAAARDVRADVLHCHQYSPFVYGALARFLRPGLRVVFTEHGRLSDAPPSRKRRLLNPVIAHAASKIASVSHDLKRHMVAEGLPEDRIEVVHNGIELGPEPASHAAADLRRRLDLPGDALIVGTVARLDPVKHLQTLVEAAAQLANRGRQVHVLVIGDGPERDRLERETRTRRLEHAVHFLGHRDDARTWLPGLDVYVNSSVSEGISLTILEAMAAGLPTVATAVGGTPEIVTGEVGLLVPARDPSAVASALEVLADQPSVRATLGRAARARVAEHFTIETMTARYLRMYRGDA
jgi:L-malate glycosyltransferase